MNSKTAYEAYIHTVLERMLNGTAPWHRPWSSPTPPSNLATGRAYRGSNALWLGLVSQDRGSPWFLTYRQAAMHGGQVRRGSKGYPVVYWQVGSREVELPDGEMEVRRTMFNRVYHVFSAQDVDGIDHLIPDEGRRPYVAHVEADRLVGLIEPAPLIRHGQSKAYYAPVPDYVGLPDRDLFQSEADYQATRFHELTHWTGHPSRLNRDTLAEMAPFGSYTYSREELVAEMGAGMLCALLGLDNQVVDQNAAYLRSWHAGLKNDPTALVWAANRAQHAADLIAGPWLKTQTTTAAAGAQDRAAAVAT